MKHHFVKRQAFRILIFGKLCRGRATMKIAIVGLGKMGRPIVGIPD
jgi:hypothetical protein